MSNRSRSAAKFYGGASRTSYKIYRSKNPTLAREATLVPSNGAKVRPGCKNGCGEAVRRRSFAPAILLKP